MIDTISVVMLKLKQQSNQIKIYNKRNSQINTNVNNHFKQLHAYVIRV